MSNNTKLSHNKNYMKKKKNQKIMLTSLLCSIHPWSESVSKISDKFAKRYCTFCNTNWKHSGCCQGTTFTPLT